MFRLLLHPFIKSSGVFVFLLTSLICAGIFSFVFVNTTYRQLFSDQLRGIYPEVMIQGAMVPDKASLPEYVHTRAEVFVKNMDVSFWDAQGLEISVKSGVRGVDVFNAEMLTNLGVDFLQAKLNTIYLSQALADILFAPGSSEQQLFLGDKFGQRIKVEVGGVFNLMNAERWLVIPSTLLKELEIGLFARTVTVFYPNHKHEDKNTFYKKLVQDLPGFSLLTWNERLPLFYRCFWDVVEAGCTLIGICALLLFGVYFWNIFQSSYLELLNSLFLLRLYGGNSLTIAGFLSIVWSGYLVCACFTANLLTFGLMALIHSETYQITPTHYLDYLIRLWDTDGLLLVSLLLLLTFVSFAGMIRSLCVQPVGEVWN